MFLIELRGKNVFQNRSILGYIENSSDFDKVRTKLKEDFNIEIDDDVVQKYDNPLIFETKDEKDIKIVLTRIYKYV
jgi:hypothetical protein